MNFETLALCWYSYLALICRMFHRTLMLDSDLAIGKITSTSIKMNTVLWAGKKIQKLFVHSKQKFNHDKIKKGIHSFFEQTLINFKYILEKSP